MSSIKVSDFLYTLPEEKIALHPLTNRDHSKLLVYRKGKIEHSSFQKLTDFLPENTSLFFNNTKVIPARLHFVKDTGAEIEIFLLHPLKPSVLLAETMHTTSTCIWQCTIGNIKRWPAGMVLTKQVMGITLNATLIDKALGHVAFQWQPSISFAEVIHHVGETPLPPYLNRKVENSDKERYQTIYSLLEGAVAAPTAGLHFTDKIFEALATKNIQYSFLTLHVSAGTFQPIKATNADDHIMHQEQIVVTQQNIKDLLLDDKFIIPVGTTSMRTLESLYWFGAKLLRDENSEFNITQDDPYSELPTPSKKIALETILQKMTHHNIDKLIGETSIFIKPEYVFRICNGLITNFHQPASTLILLVAALVGNDWRKIYNEALENDYRFLSYGDSSLLIP
jgi:S-adenosylmethionine:tRNA ribosyltransferase-isomerase